jgi:hypothetical protein
MATGNTAVGVGVGIGQGGDASAVGFGGSAINAGNRQNSFVTNNDFDSNRTSLNNQNIHPRQHHNTPSFANFVPMGTAPCLVPFGGSGVGAGFGFGFSSSLKDENCMINQSASVAAVNLKNQDLAMEIFCSGKYARNTPTCMNLNIDQAQIKRRLGQQLSALEGQTKQTQRIIDEAYSKPAQKREDVFFDATRSSFKE